MPVRPPATSESCASCPAPRGVGPPPRTPNRASARLPAPARQAWRANRLALAVDPVSVSIVISASREHVFDYLQDIANHSEFTDHYLVDWHLTRIDSIGVG